MIKKFLSVFKQPVITEARLTLIDKATFMKTTLLTLAIVTLSSVATVAQNFHLDKEYKVNATGIIDLGSSDAKVYITGSKRATAHVKIDREVTTKGILFGDDDQEFKVEVSEENGNLRLRERKSGTTVGVVGVYNEKYRIEIAAPEGMSLTVRGDDGDYFIKNINGSMELSLDDADVELADCKGSRFTFRMDDGDLKMDQGRGSLEIDGDDSDVQIYNGRFSEVHADVDDGDLRIETSLDDKGEYFFESQDGLIALTILSGGGEFDIRHDDASVHSGSDFKTISENENSTKLSLPRGTAKIVMRADDASVRLTTR
jgi:hypothetical protein